MSQECFICGAPLTYFDKEIEMECALCKKIEKSRCACTNGHYVCDACHMSGIDQIFSVCLSETSKNPLIVLERLMSLPFCHMHGPEHHVMVGCALLTAYRNAGGAIELSRALIELKTRMEKVPGGICGFLGTCGAGVSAGAFLSVVTGANPLSVGEWGLANEMTGNALLSIGKIGGPRCCKRNSYLSVLQAVKFVKERLQVEMELCDVACRRCEGNNQCIKERCPFWKRKKIAFICIHNSCRSQIAEALGKKFFGDRYDFYSAGTCTKDQINQDAVRIMKERYGVDMEQTQSCKTMDALPKVDVLISMGCGVTCPIAERAFDDDWGLPDPTGEDDETFVQVIETIKERLFTTFGK